MSSDNHQQLQWVKEGLRDDPDVLLRLGQGRNSLTFMIQIDPSLRSRHPGVDPAMIGAGAVILRLEELWKGVNDERLWGLMLGDLIDLVVDEWEISRREQGPWKHVLDAHLLLGQQRGWLTRSPLISQMFGKSTSELVELANNPANSNIAGNAPKGGCYVATAVYGSYDCPQVWVLRRFRDEILSRLLLGRLFIAAYYALSPHAVRYMPSNTRSSVRGSLDALVRHLMRRGFADTPYSDTGSSTTNQLRRGWT